MFALKKKNYTSLMERSYHITTKDQLPADFRLVWVRGKILETTCYFTLKYETCLKVISDVISEEHHDKASSSSFVFLNKCREITVTLTHLILYINYSQNSSLSARKII